MPSGLSDLDRARLRWRARRGLLENDLIITRFLDAHESTLAARDVQALTHLFEMGDNELLDVLLGRADLSGDYDDPDIRRLVEQMKAISL
ncbi:FAD assembly factor SdhE [Castellaniella sp. S9]|uniref:FAD assembly factor SdhE n=1 Tax=Castellaniella sp. S9 TaxID=2993652 RepID=UPI0022B374F6|nr:succinate dehydrogenase assembly factor 2 [Castellaniella sp. S9]